MAFSQSTIDIAWKRAGGRCEKCGKQLVYANHEDGERGAWEAHHKKAVKDGGSDDLGNCQILCLSCHRATRSYGSHD